MSGRRRCGGGSISRHPVQGHPYSTPLAAGWAGRRETSRRFGESAALEFHFLSLFSPLPSSLFRELLLLHGDEVSAGGACALFCEGS